MLTTIIKADWECDWCEKKLTINSTDDPHGWIINQGDLPFEHYCSAVCRNKAENAWENGYEDAYEAQMDYFENERTKWLKRQQGEYDQ